jgi:hypothetical protein
MIQHYCTAAQEYFSVACHIRQFCIEAADTHKCVPSQLQQSCTTLCDVNALSNNINTTRNSNSLAEGYFYHSTPPLSVMPIADAEMAESDNVHSKTRQDALSARAMYLKPVLRILGCHSVKSFSLSQQRSLCHLPSWNPTQTLLVAALFLCLIIILVTFKYTSF